jgi:hypothetical protein
MKPKMHGSPTAIHRLVKNPITVSREVYDLGYDGIDQLQSACGVGWFVYSPQLTVHLGFGSGEKEESFQSPIDTSNIKV